MGLDMYLEGRKSRYDKQETEDGFPLQTKVLELGYWRKHPNLHGYIVQEFADGVDECQRGDLPSRKHVRADRDHVGGEMVEDPLVEALEPGGQHRQRRLDRELLDELLVELPALR